MNRGLGLLVLGAATLVALASTASAESRLFSVRTMQPGVTIVQATVNGRNLPVAGQNGSSTFFRIDNPSGAVPCSNRLRFVASDGTSVDAPVDLCANNWTLTVATGANAPTPQPQNPQPMVPAIGQPVAVTTDDPDVTITDVFVAARPVAIVARRDPYVQIYLPPAPGASQCSRDLGLALSDGRRIARLVDVCQSNGLVVVPIAGSGYAPKLPPSFGSAQNVQPLPPPPVVQNPQPIPPPPPVQAQPMQWFFSAPGGTATLAYAVPGGGAGAFNAVCSAHSGSAQITLGASAPEVRPGKYVPVTFSAGAFRNTYSGMGSPRSESDGLSHPVVSVTLSDPLWAALITERSFAMGVGNAPPGIISLAGSSQQVKQFLNVCVARAGQGGALPPPPNNGPGFPPDDGGGFGPLEPPPPPGFGQAPQPGYGQPPVPPAGLGGSIDYVCDDGTDLNVVFRGNTASVMEPGRPPLTLFQAPSQQGSRYVSDNAQLVGDGENVYWRRGGGDTLTCSPQ
jgi:hypothetical protein